MTTETIPTITLLWEKLQFKAAQASDRENCAVRYPEKAENWRLFAQKAREEYAPIRQQLLERLDLIKVDTPNNRHAYMLFGFTGANDQAISFIPRNDHDEEFMPTAEQCNELSAIFAFCGWELQQRQKEAKNG